MGAKEIRFEERARTSMLRGIDALADAVGATLGPGGSRVVIEGPGGIPSITKDGATVAEAIELEDRFENMGAQLVRQVAAKVSETVGDGSTTAIVLARALYREGVKWVAAGHDPMRIKRGIERAVGLVVSEIRDQSKPLECDEDVARVATTSAGGDARIGRSIADAILEVGTRGIVRLEENHADAVDVDIVDGTQIEAGYCSPHFVTDQERTQVSLQKCLVLLHEQEISSTAGMLHVLELVAKQRRPLLVMAGDVRGEALKTLVLNVREGTVQAVAVKVRASGDRRRRQLEDLAILTGAKLISRERGDAIDGVTLDDLGTAEKVTVDRILTTIIGGGGNARMVAEEIEHLDRELSAPTTEHERAMLQARRGMLAGRIAVIRIGAASEAEAKERRARFEDALCATRAAVEEGVVPGGGVALLRAQSALDARAVTDEEERSGVKIVRRALEEPLRRIATNAGAAPSVVVEQVRRASPGHGFDARSMTIVDLLATGVIDPAKVARTALEHAASVAAVMLAIEAMIADATERERPSGGAGAAGYPIDGG